MYVYFYILRKGLKIMNSCFLLKMVYGYAKAKLITVGIYCVAAHFLATISTYDERII